MAVASGGLKSSTCCAETPVEVMAPKLLPAWLLVSGPPNCV
jgi:hypothetical protein